MLRILLAVRPYITAAERAFVVGRGRIDGILNSLMTVFLLHRLFAWNDMGKCS
jgi:hypothetical protein